MNDIDFSRTYLRWTSPHANHTPRLAVEAACAVVDSRGRRDFYLSAACTGESMYADSLLIHLPAYEFAMVAAPGEEYMFYKVFADGARDLIESHRVGEAMSTQDGRGAPIADLAVDVARHARVRELRTYGEIREAILGNATLNARTQYSWGDDGTRIVMDYPVKVCNIAHGKERWQVDTGPVLLQDPTAASEPAVGMLRPGYIVFNRWDWAEVTVRAIQVVAPSASHFSAGRRLEAANSIYRCG